MESMRQTWTDDRMDDLNAKVGGVGGEVRALRGETRTEFTAVRAETRAEFVAVRAEMKAGFDRVDQRLDRLIFVLLGLLATGLAALFTHL